jgi:hypothetical protein
VSRGWVLIGAAGAALAAVVVRTLVAPPITWCYECGTPIYRHNLDCPACGAIG